jgi:hypothetical protein
MSALVDAWVAAYAAEEQAVFGYGLAGPYLPTPAQIALAMSCMSAHESLRDSTAVALLDAGHQPPPPPADYPQLYPVSVGTVAITLAVRLEQEAAVAWRYLYAQAASTRGAQATALRTSAQTALTASAVRGVQWRRTLTPASATVAFPGI